MAHRLLAIDTSTEACSAALLVGDTVRECYQLAPRAHAQLILGMIEELMSEAELIPQQLDAIAFGCGPGAFTGVRIATGVVQGIAFGASLPVIPVSSLAALAQDAMDRNGTARVLTAIDARMGELYWGAYRREADGCAHALFADTVANAIDVELPSDDEIWMGTGSGWGAFGDILRTRLGERMGEILVDRFPRARAVARLGEAAWRRGELTEPESALPVYLRNRVVHTQ